MTISLPWAFPHTLKSQNLLPTVKPSETHLSQATHQHHKIPCLNSEAGGSSAEAQQQNLIWNHSLYTGTSNAAACTPQLKSHSYSFRETGY